MEQGKLFFKRGFAETICVCKIDVSEIG